MVKTNLSPFKGIFQMIFLKYDFDLGVHCIFVSNWYTSIKFFTEIMISSKFKIWNASILGKMTNLNAKIIIYLLAWHFHRLFWNNLAKYVRTCVLKNSANPFMSIVIFSWINIQKHEHANLSSANNRQFFLSFRWNK